MARIIHLVLWVVPGTLLRQRDRRIYPSGTELNSPGASSHGRWPAVVIPDSGWVARR
jgi:hypothetical protein